MALPAPHPTSEVPRNAALILSALRRGPATTGDLIARCSLTPTAARKAIAHLRAAGTIRTEVGESGGRVGAPAQLHSLKTAGA